MTDIALSDEDEDRPLGSAILRGLRLRCPACGKGHLMQGYLKVRHDCSACGEALHHQRADDGPAYLTIMVVGHLMAPLLFFVFVTFRPTPLVMAGSFALGCTFFTLLLLPRMKGLVVAVQWAKRMHGFGTGTPDV